MSPAPRSQAPLAFALAFLVAAPASAAGAGSRSERADDDPVAQIARAVELACSGRYAEARASYARIAERHAGAPEAAIAAERARPSAFLGACDLVRAGPSSNRVDVVLLGDGYELEHLRAFDQLAADVPPILARVEPFREYAGWINVVRGVCVSAQSGVDGFGREYDTALGGWTRDTDAGHVGVDGSRVREVLDRLPAHDGLAIVFVKLGVLGTGGAGIAVIGGRDATTTVHEWGHAFAGLGDEYAERTHDRAPGAPRPNVAVTDDPKRVPWRHWIDAKHPSIGVYEGASGQVRGAWRPTASGCVMEGGETFCAVCREALVLRLYSLVDPIESTDPAPPPSPIREPIQLADGAVELEVRVLRPATHALEVRWWVQPESRMPATGERSLASIRAGPDALAADAQGLRADDRRRRGRLAPIVDDPVVEDVADADGRHVLRLARADLEPGRYRVVCRVRDAARPRGEKWPWVIEDALGLLESERVWWLLVR